MFAVQLTDWERQQLSLHASTVALTYLGNNFRGALFPHEVEEMERWKALSDKFRTEEPEAMVTAPI